jgi:dTDP-4-dehydrorhamnose reductase
MGSLVLVFGLTGPVAREIASAEWPGGAEPVFLDRAATDLGVLAQLGPVVRRQAPDAIVRCCPHTAVDRAESRETWPSP